MRQDIMCMRSKTNILPRGSTSQVEMIDTIFNNGLQLLLFAFNRDTVDFSIRLSMNNYG